MFFFTFFSLKFVLSINICLYFLKIRNIIRILKNVCSVRIKNSLIFEDTPQGVTMIA